MTVVSYPSECFLFIERAGFEKSAILIGRGDLVATAYRYHQTGR